MLADAQREGCIPLSTSIALLMSLAHRYLARHPSPMCAYMALQRDMLRRYVRLYGGTGVEFIERHHATFRRQFGWMLGR